MTDEWIERLVGLVGTPQRRDIDWARYGSRNGMVLPSSYRSLAEVFGPGAFSRSVNLLAVDPGKPMDLYGGLVAHQQAEDAVHPGGPDGPYAPYSIFRGRGEGLIPWGWSEWDEHFYWLASEEVAPDEWPILAATDDFASEGWFRFEMSVPQFVWTILTTFELAPFGWDEQLAEHTFLSASSVEMT
ncbi:hypothetical protein [Antribacter gilvus]|uniref:hypothetical protein n=1 Tax=Antribacter gilvus TaxID=2304675 RepID=UPI000F79657C|nr:hypothetical protein [Antribacter gilvus]